MECVEQKSAEGVKFRAVVNVSSDVALVSRSASTTVTATVSPERYATSLLRLRPAGCAGVAAGVGDVVGDGTGVGIVVVVVLVVVVVVVVLLLVVVVVVGVVTVMAVSRVNVLLAPLEQALFRYAIRLNS